MIAIFRKKKNSRNDCNNYDYEEICKFYIILLKYKKQHINFNLDSVILKLYPKIDLNILCKHINN